MCLVRSDRVLHSRSVQRRQCAVHKWVFEEECCTSAATPPPLPPLFKFFFIYTNIYIDIHLLRKPLETTVSDDLTGLAAEKLISSLPKGLGIWMCCF